MAEPAQPVLDASRYRQLAIELKSDDDAMRFIAVYWHMMPDRVSRILAALRDEDAAAAMDAVLSLKVTSSMTGALQVEHDCLRLEQDLRDGAQTDLLEASARLALDVPPLQAALQELFRPGERPLNPKVLLPKAEGPGRRNPRRRPSATVEASSPHDHCKSRVRAGWVDQIALVARVLSG